jgi:hypothetical protein
MRLRVAACIIVLLATQSVGVVHWHPAGDLALKISAQSRTADTLCPICQLAFHSPGAIASPVIFAVPRATLDRLIPLPFLRPRSELRRWTDSRAPPALDS